MDFTDSGLDVQLNDLSWGPVLGERVVAYDEIPYAHFDKKDKCWRHADFTVQGQQQKQYARYRPRGGDESNLGNTEFSYRYDAAEDSTFKLVDTTKTQSRKPKRTWAAPVRGGVGNVGANTRYSAGGRGGGAGVGGRGSGGFGRNDGPTTGRGPKSRQSRYPQRRNDRKSDRLPSLVVKSNWEVIEEIDLVQLNKLQTNLPKVDDLAWCGHLDQYDDTYEKVTTKAPRPLRRIQNKLFHYVTTTDDPVIEKFILEGVGNVFATDAIISHLMAASRSVNSWDIVIQKVNDMIFLDKRDNSQFDYLTVSETANDPPQANEETDEINQPDKLSIEATVINQNFSQQILKDPLEGRKLVCSLVILLSSSSHLSLSVSLNQILSLTKIQLLQTLSLLPLPIATVSSR
jgi:translation initiation factor 3 subunit D